MTAPTVEDVQAYLSDSGSHWDTEAVTAAHAAEKAAQARRCRVPADDAEWPADLAEALCRRVAANLANRSLPLGLQSSITEVGAAFARTGGGDREVTRLEAPYRRLVVG